ncbi:MAG: hypothetical protein ACFB0E_22525 [Leptolyngbyaceae cyanobacterium]
MLSERIFPWASFVSDIPRLAIGEQKSAAVASVRLPFTDVQNLTPQKSWPAESWVLLQNAIAC